MERKPGLGGMKEISCFDKKYFVIEKVKKINYRNLKSKNYESY